MQWPRREAGFWEELPVFRLLLPFVAGIALYDAFPQKLSPAVALGVAVGFLVVLVGLARVRKLGNAYLTLRFGTLGIFLGITGYGLSAAADVRNRADWVGNLSKNTGSLILAVTAPPKPTPKTWRLETTALSYFDTLKSKPVSGKVLLTVFKNDDSICRLGVGDTLVIPARLEAHGGPSHPFGFDARRFYNRQNNYHQLALGTNEVMLVGKMAPKAEGPIARMNRWASGALDRHVADADTRALLQAMLLGNETDFDPEIRQTYADTGVIHVVAISGSHLATLFLIFFFIPYLIRGVWGRRVQYSLGLVAVWTYVLLAGAPPSAIRAAVVFTLLAGSILLDVRHSTLNTLLMGVFLILCFQPMWVYAVGFQLSVLAVLSIILFYPHVQRLIVVRNPVLRVMWNALVVSFCAQILVAPLSVYYFHNFPVFFLVANLAAWLLIGVIGMFGGIGVLVFSGMPAVAGSIATGTAFFVHLFNRFIRGVQGWNPPSFRHLHLSFGELILWYLLIGTCAVFLFYKSKKAFFGMGLSLAALLGCSVCYQTTALRQDRLVAYSKSGTLVADHIHGRHFQPLFTELPEDSLKAAKTTRIGYNAWRKAAFSDTNAVQKISGKTVLFYRDSANRFAAPLDVPIDILFIARPLKGLSPSQLRAAFKPKMLVTGSLDKRWRVLAWKDSCKALSQPFHATLTDGAFVLE